MQELTFGRSNVYPKAVSPEIEAKRERVRDVFRATLQPSYVAAYNDGVVPLGDEIIIGITKVSVEGFLLRNPGMSLMSAKNTITMAKQEWEIRKIFPAI
jgi:hypothetical protein